MQFEEYEPIEELLLDYLEQLKKYQEFDEE
jgi:hypothetical protein